MHLEKYLLWSEIKPKDNFNLYLIKLNFEITLNFVRLQSIILFSRHFWRHFVIQLTCIVFFSVHWIFKLPAGCLSPFPLPSTCTQLAESLFDCVCLSECLLNIVWYLVQRLWALFHPVFPQFFPHFHRFFFGAFLASVHFLTWMFIFNDLRFSGNLRKNMWRNFGTPAPRVYWTATVSCLFFISF